MIDFAIKGVDYEVSSSQAMDLNKLLLTIRFNYFLICNEPIVLNLTDKSLGVVSDLK